MGLILFQIKKNNLKVGCLFFNNNFYLFLCRKYRNKNYSGPHRQVAGFLSVKLVNNIIIKNSNLIFQCSSYDETSGRS